MQPIPTYNTPEYWKAVACGKITWEEAEQRQADQDIRRKRAQNSKYNKAPTLPRHNRPAPSSSKQFCKKMATTAARDDRLTPQAKALLQIITARTGEERSTDTTKTTLGKILNRCPRSIQRYIAELVKFDYIRTQTIKSRRSGLYVAMRIWIMNAVLPYYAENPGYEPSSWLNLFAHRGNSEETIKSLTNNSYLSSGILCQEKPPWFSAFTFR